ncbi:MAG: hypothetical protein GC189_12410 [Alphaproteobacteria bacterium]|nr:hypothetical protein [Alphaproteobacteria bacterium]
MTQKRSSGEESSQGGAGREAADPPQEFKPAGAVGDDPLTRNLKKVYAEVAAEPIPDEWMAILGQLDDPNGGLDNA